MRNYLEFNLNENIKKDVYNAIKNGDIDIVKKYIDEHEINGFSYYGKSLIHKAVSENKLEIVKFLVENGININILDRVSFTPIMTATYDKNYDIMKYLIRVGANPNIHAMYSTILGFVADSSNIDEKGVDILLGADDIELYLSKDKSKLLFDLKNINPKFAIKYPKQYKKYLDLKTLDDYNI